MYEAIPQELKNLKQWVCWRFEPDESRPGKIKKIPINAMTGWPAQSNNPSTWATYEAAVLNASRYDGIGFMFANGYFGIDIDKVQAEIAVYKNDDTDNIVAEFVHQMQSYAEYSVSGNGIHIICKGSLPPGSRRRNNVEMYSEGRFFIMTGNIAGPYKTIADGTSAVKSLHEKYIGGGFVPTTGIIKTLPLNLSEAEVLKLAERSKQGKMFADLYAGNYQSYFPSQSEADMSLCNMLAFWCRKDEALMDKIFRTSGLMRPKWDRKQSGSTYGQLTIRKAARQCSNVYEPKAEYGIQIGTKPKRQKKLYSFDDTGNAQRFVDRFGDSVRYCFPEKRWMYYDGRKWCLDNVGVVRCMVDEVVEEMRQDLDFYIENSSEAIDAEELEKQFLKHIKTSRSSKAKAAMLKECEHRKPILPSGLDQHVNLLNTPNGVLNLVSGELLPHEGEKFLSKITWSEFTDKSDHPLWDQFLRDIFNDDGELIHYVQKAIGYSLTGSTDEQCAFFCYGTGRNGKSTFLDTIFEVLGDYAINIQPETLMIRAQSGGPNSDIARLRGARFVTSVEPNEGVRLNEGLVKQLTGGDKVTARKLYSEEFEFTPEFKLWMGTNHKPVIRGTDTGIWRRIHLIPFTVQIPESKVDKHLKYKLRQEMPGILSWAVEGCLLWQREGLKMPQVIYEAVKEYRDEMDVISAFLESCCILGAGEEKASDLYAAYAKWAQENNEYKMPGRKFAIELGKKFSKYKSHGVMKYQGLILHERYIPYSVSIGG